MLIGSKGGYLAAIIDRMVGRKEQLLSLSLTKR